MPQKPGRPQHGDLHEKIHAYAKEKREPRCKGIDIETGSQGGFDIFQTVCQGKGRLKNRIGTGLHHVVAADADRVVLGHMLGAIADDIGYNSHGGFRWIDIGVAGQVFL